MKVLCKQENLNYGIQIANKAISSKIIEPIYGNIMLETAENELKLAATSGDITIEVMIEVENIEQHGSITVPAKELSNLVGTYDPGQMEIESDDARVITLKTRGCHYQLNGLSADQFPSSPQLIGEDCLIMKQADLKSMLKETGFAIAPPDEVRAVLKGSLFEISDNTLNVVSADGRRMAKKTATLLSSGGQNYEVIVPKKTLTELLRILKDNDEEIKIYISDSQIDFQIDKVRILSGLIQGKFPNYRQVIPAHCDQSLRIDKNAFYKALKRASFVAQDLESPNLVKLKIHASQLIITANTQDLGQAYEEVDLEEPGQSIDISFNAKYLLDALSCMAGPEILFELSNPVNPGIIRPSNDDKYIYVIMPVRLK